KYCIIVPSKCISGQILLNNLSQEQYQNIKGIGISEPVFSLDKIQEAIEEANLLSYQYFINGEKICRYDLKENFKKGDEFVKDIIENYFKRKFFYGTFQKEIERLSSENGINIKHAFTIYNFITHYNNSYEAQSQDTIYGFNELTKLFSDFKSMCRYLDKTSSTEIGTRMKEARTINFSQILNYIDSNFCEDITIQDISEKYYINPSYLSQLFRKELGITFTDYLVKKRMEFAKELMQDENIKTVDIYQKCGYNDYFYFIRCFKKYFGKSPGQYRNS
ncbi:MAG: response regulator, partial [Eubacterium sp.]|nr:response regulator [Eubacterium sp.]